MIRVRLDQSEYRFYTTDDILPMIHATKGSSGPDGLLHVNVLECLSGEGAGADTCECHGAY